MKLILKRIIGSLAVFVALVAVYTIIVNVRVKSRTEGRIYEDVDSVPHNKVALLLGTNPLNRYGRPNSYFTNRIDMAAELYHAGKVDYIIASGDNHIKAYDEPTAMKDSLMAHGVPESRIILDFAGFRTLDSVVRAKEVFGCDSLTIISQRDHCERALYLAQANGIEAIAVTAPLRAGRWVRTRLAIREWLARDKMMLDLWFGKRPHFLGEKIDLPEVPRQKSYSATPGVTLEILNIDEMTAPLDSISLKIHNNTDSLVTYGEWFGLQINSDGNWDNVRTDQKYRDSDGVIYVVWNSIAYILFPHTSNEKTEKPWFYGDNLVPGHYRLAKPISIGEYVHEKDTLYVEFDIR